VPAGGGERLTDSLPAAGGLHGATLKATIENGVISIDAAVQTLPALDAVVKLVEHLAEDRVHMPPCKVRLRACSSAPHFSY
jgi:hypothetical protein